MKDILNLTDTEVAGLILLLGPFAEQKTKRWAEDEDFERVDAFFVANSGKYFVGSNPKKLGYIGAADSAGHVFVGGEDFAGQEGLFAAAFFYRLGRLPNGW